MTFEGNMRYLPWLAMLCFLAYAPSLFLPLIEDDYPIITESRAWGRPAALTSLVATPVFRQRATSYWATLALWQTFHLRPAAFHAVSLALHIVNTWLVFWLGLLWARMRPAALWAAMFFAVQEGHQEAVMWYTAINELLMFGFGIGALVCWLAAEKTADGNRGARFWWRALSVVLFALAMMSKESAVILPAFFFLVIPPAEWRRAIPRLLPYLVLAGVMALSIFAARSDSFRFNDGSFSTGAPFWITWPRGMARVLWIWGWPALLVVRKKALLPLAWIGIALALYCFLTSSTEIPSRQTYLATVGLVFLFGLAIAHLRETGVSPKLVTAILVVMVLHNAGYLWTKKRGQFLRRAEPTRQLIKLARETNGPIWVRCFPRTSYIAKEAVHVAAGRPASDLVWSASEAEQRKAAVVFCYQER